MFVWFHRSFSAVIRDVVRIFSEVRTILQITLHPHSPPPKKKTSSIKHLIVSLRVFFCIWNDISSLWNTLSVFGSIDWCTSIIYPVYKGVCTQATIMQLGYILFRIRYFIISAFFLELTLYFFIIYSLYIFFAHDFFRYARAYRAYR